MLRRVGSLLRSVELAGVLAARGAVMGILEATRSIRATRTAHATQGSCVTRSTRATRATSVTRANRATLLIWATRLAHLPLLPKLPGYPRCPRNLGHPNYSGSHSDTRGSWGPLGWGGIPTFPKGGRGAGGPPSALPVGWISRPYSRYHIWPFLRICTNG